MSDPIAAAYLEDVRAQFRKHKTLAERAMVKLDDDAVFALLDDEANSLAILAKHARGADWQTLSIPRGGSKAFNTEMRRQMASDE